MERPSGLAASTTAEGGELSGLSPEIVKLLEQPLNRKLVARRKSFNGETRRYLEGHVVIQQANRIFGLGQWGSDLAGPIEYRPLLSPEGSNGHGIYTAIVRVTVRGSEAHVDVGTGAVAEPTAEGHDTAIKGAVTDALKRAFRPWGPQFGLSLYERANAERISAANELADLRATVVLLGHTLGLDDTMSRKSAAAKAGRRFDRLTCPELAAVIRAMAEAVTKRQKAA